jgi:uncharacterized protein YecE (DUF72 family)
VTVTKYNVGTSGWIYKDWVSRFYPKDLKDDQKLAFYASQFSTVEINYSFYRLPTAEAFRAWHNQVPKEFSFSVKLSRFLTHLKQLKVDDRTNEGIDRFASRACQLQDKLAVVLIQLPSSFKADGEKVSNLFNQFKAAEAKYGLRFRLAIEGRHESWFQPETIEQLKEHQIALVINSNPKQLWPTGQVVTADFAYLRFHGSQALYASNYSDEEISEWAEKIKIMSKNQTKIYCYFNNDKSARAVHNAQALLAKLSQSRV